MIKKYEIKAVKVNSEFAFPDKKITRSGEAAEIFREILNGDMLICESFCALFLNRGNKVIAWAKISTGGISQTTVDPIIICKYAIDTLAQGVIFAHNHPSGNLTPSTADIEITKKLTKCLDTFDIKVLDHCIITENGYYSLSDEGII